MRALRILFTLVIALAPGAAAQSVQEQIDDEVERFVATVNAGDPAALAALYLNDPNVTSIGDGEITTGWSDVSKLLHSIYDEFGSINMVAESVTVLPLSEDAAVAVLRYYWLLGSEDSEYFIGAMTLVYRRTPNGWRIAHDHTSSLLDYNAVIGDSGPPAPIRDTSPCVITRIIDGDTIECRSVGRVRLIGMDTPETSQEPYGDLATEALAALAPVGSTVELELDVEPRDRYGRVLAYVWAEGLLVNWALVRQGWAVVLTYPPNVQYVDWFTAAQERAREDRVGLWEVDAFDCLPVDRRRGRCE